MNSFDKNSLLAILDLGAPEWNAWRLRNPTVWPDLREMSRPGIDLSGARLENANLLGANLQDAFLQEANFRNANLKDSNLTRANLVGASLREANLHNSDLRYADLSRTDLVHANLGYARLDGARVDYALMGSTSLGLTSLARVHGWERVFHLPDQSSSMDLETIRATVEDLQTRGERLSYFRLMMLNMGMPAEIADYYISRPPRRRWSTCFVSFSTEDSAFVERLDGALLGRGVSCFVAPRQSVAGANVIKEIEANIALRERVVVVCSEASMQSGWVQREIEFATQKKIATGTEAILLPVDIDRYIRKSSTAEFPVGLLREHVIVDFTQWRSEKHFASSVARLLDGLRRATA